MKYLLSKIIFSSIAMIALTANTLSANAASGSEGANGGWPTAARALLQEVKTELAANIRKGGDAFLKHTLVMRPEGEQIIKFDTLTAEQIASIVDATVQMTNEELENENKIAKYFDYGLDSDQKPKIFARKAFYYSYSSVAAKDATVTMRLELKRKLVHELSHLWGYTEAQSESFSRAYAREVSNIWVAPRGDESHARWIHPNSAMGNLNYSGACRITNVQYLENNVWREVDDPYSIKALGNNSALYYLKVKCPADDALIVRVTQAKDGWFGHKDTEDGKELKSTYIPLYGEVEKELYIYLE